MDYSTKIAESLNMHYGVEVHKSTTALGRYRVYTFDPNGTLVETFLVGVQQNGNVTGEFGNVLATITL